MHNSSSDTHKGRPRTQEREGPLGDVIPDADDRDTRTGGAQPPEPVERRPNVGQVTPEDYPAKDRADGAITRKEA